MAAKQSDVLRPYKPGEYPAIPGGESQYLQTEYAKLQNTTLLLIQVVKQLDARLIAGAL